METGNVIIRLIADMKEFMAGLTEGEAKIAEFGASAETMGTQFNKGLKTAQNAVIGLGVAVAAYGVKSAYDYVEALDKLRTQAGASAAELDYVKKAALGVSTETARASSEIVDAYLQVEKAGIRGAKATDLVTNAAKAAAITGSKTVDVAKQIVAAQTTQIAKGMSVAQITDLIVKANQMHIGSLQSLFSVLSGKVGVALAAHNVTMAQAAAVSNIAAKAGYTNTRTLNTLAVSLSKVENPTKSYAKSLASLGINANALAADAKKPGGLMNVLKDIGTVAQRTGQSVSTVANAVFGSSGGALATLLVKNMPTLTRQVTTLGSASQADLAKQFGITQEQLGYKVTELKNTLHNLEISVGLALLPTLEKMLNGVVAVFNYFKKHPLIEKIATDAAIGLFVAAVVSKLTAGIKSVISTFQGIMQTNYLRQIAINTAVIAEEGGVKGAPGGGFWAGALGWFKSAVRFVPDAILAGIGLKGLQATSKMFTDPAAFFRSMQQSNFSSMWHWAFGGGGTPAPTKPAPIFPGKVLPYGPTPTGGPVKSTAVVRVH